MFDSLQEGIIVLKNGELEFTNELANRVMSEISGLKNFFFGRT